MLIKTVKLNNIRSYLDEAIEFPNGSVLLSGDIGSGKSSILLALEFALFGTRKGTGEALLRNGKREGFVELSFILEGKEIIIKRNLKRGKDGIKQEAGFIIIDGIKHELTAEELKAKILELLGYPAEFLKRNIDILFRYTVYTPQEEMKKILLDEPELRLDTLRKIFAVDKYKRINENSRILVKEIRERKKEIEGKTFDLELKKAQKREHETELGGLNNAMERLRPELAKLRENLADKKIELKNAESRLREYMELKNNYELLQTRFSDKYLLVQKLNNKVQAFMKDIENLRAKTESNVIAMTEEELEEKLASNNHHLLTMSDKKIKTESRLENLRNNLKELENDTKEYDNLMVLIEQKRSALEDAKYEDPDVLKTKIRRMNDEILEVSSEIIKLEDNITKSNELASKVLEMRNCPLCRQDVKSEHKEHIKKTEKEKMESLNRQLENFMQRKQEVSKKLDKLNNELEQCLSIKNKAEKLTIEMEYLNEELTRILNKKSNTDILRQQIEQIEQENKEILDFDIEIINKEIAELNKKLKLARELKNALYQLDIKERAAKETEDQIAELKREIGKINLDKGGISKKLEHYLDAEENYNRIKEKYEEITEQVKLKEISYAEIQKDISSTMRLIKNIDEEIKLKQKLKEKIHFLNSFENWLENFFAYLMENMERHVMSRVYQEFNEFFQQWFYMLIEDENLNVRLDDTYNPIIEQNGYETSLENLSGGERTSCALAYRLALNKVINDVVGDIKTKDIIILDEPTEGFSTEQLDRVRTVLDQLGIRQVIIVSHEDKIESFVEHVIRIYKEEHVSRVMA